MVFLLYLGNGSGYACQTSKRNGIHSGQSSPPSLRLLRKDLRSSGWPESWETIERQELACDDRGWSPRSDSTDEVQHQQCAAIRRFPRRPRCAAMPDQPEIHEADVLWHWCTSRSAQPPSLNDAKPRSC